MAGKSKIEWTDETWNPVTGCTKVSDGCKNCYAERLWPKIEGARLAREDARGTASKARKFTDVACHEERLEIPLHWKKPRRVFVNSMSDLFHEAVPDEYIDRVFAVMASRPQHTFQVLTKRPERMREWADTRTPDEGRNEPRIVLRRPNIPGIAYSVVWPLPNVWLGVSAENQAAAELRIPDLLATPAAVRFVSYEPALGPVDFGRIVTGHRRCQGRPDTLNALTGESEDGHGEHSGMFEITHGPALDWIICGGESGPKARPMHPDWARSVRDQCQAAGVSFFFKQWGEFGPDQVKPVEYTNVRSGVPMDEPAPMYRVGKKAAGRVLDGREWNEMPVLSGAEGPGVAP